MQIGETDTRNRTLIIAHWKGLLYAAGNVFSVCNRNDVETLQVPSWKEALDEFNRLGGTSIPYEFQEQWLKWYNGINKNPLTGTRVGKDSSEYWTIRNNKVQEWMKTHKAEVEAVRVRNGLK